MPRSTVTVALAVLAILTMPVVSLAQSAGNSAQPSVAPGTNSAGTAQSSGSGLNTGPGVTTGAAGTGSMATTSKSTDAAINEENKTIDRRLKSICRGC